MVIRSLGCYEPEPPSGDALVTPVKAGAGRLGAVKSAL
jgi:hypothetical protein